MAHRSMARKLSPHGQTHLPWVIWWCSWLQRGSQTVPKGHFARKTPNLMAKEIVDHGKLHRMDDGLWIIFLHVGISMIHFMDYHISSYFHIPKTMDFLNIQCRFFHPIIHHRLGWFLNQLMVQAPRGKNADLFGHDLSFFRMLNRKKS